MYDLYLDMNRLETAGSAKKHVSNDAAAILPISPTPRLLQLLHWLLLQLHESINRHVRPREGALQLEGMSGLSQYLSGTTLTTEQFTAKQLNRQAAKAGKDETTEKAKLKKVQHSSNLYAYNAVSRRSASMISNS